ncbi:hypothetical protein EUTSA_v10022906mg [Eutrema salsugineum]|uniref:Uncharacterized protein n=1 Tax=Eutrema salsugineum TaxID=72664 RepID=V4M4B8_EUTSA|nr:hypothetical protein EUTSA_v10022906mg [Eutrema salsugineum]
MIWEETKGGDKFTNDRKKQVWLKRIGKAETLFHEVKMMKHTQAILGKYRGRAFSTVESTRLRLYSGAKQVCKEQEGLVLGAGAAFMGGYAVYFCKCMVF